MSVARELPQDSGMVTVVAQSQTRGRGRFERVWVSPPKGGLYLTVRMPWDTRPLAQAPLVSLGCALALARLCRELGIGSVSLKWPNDLILSGGKAAGILAEMIHPQGVPVLLVGVGIDVDLPGSSLEGVGQPTTTLSRQAGRTLDCECILERFLQLWSEVDRALESDGFACLVEEFRSFSDVEGRTFRLAGTGPTRRIRVRSVQDDGSLEVESLSSGEVITVYGGELLPDAT